MFALIERLISFLIAIYAIRSGLLFLSRLVSGFQHRPTTTAQTPSSRQAPQQGATLLQQDPVCGTYVAIDASLKRIVHGKVIHFCSPECRDRYQTS